LSKDTSSPNILPETKHNRDTEQPAKPTGLNHIAIWSRNKTVDVDKPQSRYL